MSSMHLKSKRKHFEAKYLQIIVIITYTLPAVYSQCILKRNDKAKSETEIRRWFHLEENLFISQITFGVLFLALAYIYKSKSIWNKNKPKYRRFSENKVVMDIWNRKNNADFLHHLKFEFMQQTLFGSYFFTCLMLIIDFKSIINKTTPVVALTNIQVSLIWLCMAHFLQMVLFQIVIWFGRWDEIEGVSKETI
jgi:hypothetical protein